MERVVEFAREREILVVHDFAYADLGFDGHEPPSILQVPGASEVAVELYTLTKSFSMAGWRVGFLVGNAAVCGALARLKSWLDYGTFQPIQIAAITAMNEAPDTPLEVREVYRSRRDTLCDGLARAGWTFPRPRGTMFAWAPVPEPFAAMGSLAFAEHLAREAKVAVSPGSGFGPRRGLRPLRPRRERAPHPTGRARDQAGARDAAAGVAGDRGPAASSSARIETTSPITTSAGAGRLSVATAIPTSGAVTTAGQTRCRGEITAAGVSGASPAATSPSESAWSRPSPMKRTSVPPAATNAP